MLYIYIICIHMYTIHAVYYMFVDLSIYLLYTKPSTTKKMYIFHSRSVFLTFSSGNHA